MSIFYNSMNILYDILRITYLFYIIFLNLRIWKPDLVYSLQIELFTFYIKINHCCVKIGRFLCNKFPIINNCIKSYNNVIHSIINWIKKYIYNFYTEPLNKKWISVCNLKEDYDDIINKTAYNYSEIYYVFNKNNSNNIVTVLKDIFETILPKLFHKKNIESMIIIKMNDRKYITHIITKNNNILNLIQKQCDFIYKLLNNKHELIRSPFLSIEYIHPKMKERISIEIPPGFFLEDNHLLSSLFIKRYLEYRNKPHYFDLNYKIKIMDKNIKMFELQNNEYIKIKNGDYYVKTI